MIIALQTLIFFRESLLNAIDRILRPYYRRLSLTFSRKSIVSSDDESEEQVFADFDDERGVVFYPPMYAQRYAAVSDCLMDERWCGKLEKIVDLGYHDMSFIKYLQEVPGIKSILGVDIESIPLCCSSELLKFDNHNSKRENPLHITLFQGNAADPDYRLIGCDAVIAIEMIEHMLPHDLERLVHTVFGFIKPWIVVFTTPNGDFNVLFKALEKNGLRRLDHFFEWSREQFNDWCSNIVVRYPEYTVSCKGIGPGPPGTDHLGCCSQLALFVARDYHKQEELNLNSLVLVANAPAQNKVKDMIDSWEIPETDNNILCKSSSLESYSESSFSDKQSHITILISSPTYSNESVKYKDNTSQCNLEDEKGKSFLMFDDEQLFQVLVPRRKYDNRVYEIEDVCCRLNCTTLQVKKFSKTTQNLMTKNKLETLAHTREVVDEIWNITRMLNLNKDTQHRPEENCIWCNINWGENAPYWNQYYKVVREYTHSYEVKTDECRILDLISDEINRLIDTQYDEEFAVDANKLEIPIKHLMKIVEHITTDVDKVKDILEWNGYEVVDNMVIHSRLIKDTASNGSQDDWLEYDTLADCCTTHHNTDLRSTTVSDGNAIIPDYHDRCLRRALVQKLHHLRTVLMVDEDITVELDKIVCRLMKLALHSSRGRRNLPTRWMQCKLLDLLTLTGKAIERRKKYFIESYPLTAIDLGHESKSEEMDTNEKIRNYDGRKSMVDKYRQLVICSIEEYINDEYALETYFEELSIPSTTELLENFEYENGDSPNLINASTDNGKLFTKKILKIDDTKLERTQSWVDEDIELIPCLKNENFDNSSGDTDRSPPKILNKHKYKIIRTRRKSMLDHFGEAEVILCKRTRLKLRKFKNKQKSVTANIDNKASRKNVIKNLFKTSSNKLEVKYYGNHHDYGRKITKKKEPCRIRASKPIPESLIKLCHPEICVPANSANIIYPKIHNSPVDNQFVCNVSATEQSYLIDIITEDRYETIALRRTIGTDMDTLVRSISGHINMENFYEQNELMTKNVHSQTIFLNDLNEPTTSKGIRHNHISTNVQCGSDTAHDYSVLSAATSFYGLTKTKSRYNIADLHVKSSDFGTCTNDEYAINTCITPRIKSIGIHIRDSDTNLDFSNKNTNCNVLNINSYSGNPIDNDISIEIDVNNSIKKSSSTKVQILYLDSFNTNNVNTNETLDIQNTLTIQLAETFNKNTEMLPCEAVGEKTNIITDKFISSTRINYQISLTNVSRKNSVSIQIKDSNKMLFDTKHNLLNCFAKVKSPVKTVCIPPMSPEDIRTDVNPSATNVLRSAQKNRNLDSVSGFNENFGSREATQESFFKSSSDFLLKSPVSNEVQKLDDIKYMRPKLCRGGVHVHCYKDKTISEDVVFQGGWQKCRPKASAKKMPPCPPSSKKINDYKCFATKKINSKEKIPTRSTTSKINTISKKPLFVSPVAKVNKPLRQENKLAAKITMSTTPPKSKISSPAKNPTEYSIALKKESTINQNLTHKCYVPTYLKRNLEKIMQLKRTEMNQGLNVTGKAIKKKKNISVSPTIEDTVNEQVKRNLLKFSDFPHENISYLVYCNEIEDSGNTDPAKETVKINDSTRRPHSSSSQNSSTCSSPNSIVTVRLLTKQKSSNKPSYISQKGVLRTGTSESTAPNKNKAIKRTKVTKISKDIDNNNKENQPQSSRQYNKDIERKCMSSFLRKNNKVFIAQIKKENPHNLSTNNSNVKIPVVDSSKFQLKIATSVSTPIKLPKLEMLKDNKETEPINDYIPDGSNIVSVLEFQQAKNIELLGETKEAKKVMEYPLLNKRLSTCNTTDNRLSITTTVRQIIEETLDLMEKSFEGDNTFDSETVILSCDEDNLSSSYKTVITSDNANSTLEENDLENALNLRSFDTVLGGESFVSFTDTRQTISNLDMISFKSITPVSKFSEYFLADNELNSNNNIFSYHDSVLDIYERKNEIITQDPPGALAIQLFSGFSLNAEPNAGDRPDLVNLIDSETGSLAVDVPRLTTSEELFVSGRSSGSYESCQQDEDSVVPNWLYHIISQQQSTDEDEPVEYVISEVPVTIPMQINDPMIDTNGNVLEPVLGAGAGDGRGMHSDHSQNSSGIDTSLSSTDTSGQQSEAVLIDPFTGQIELLRESADSGIVVPEGAVASENRMNEGPIISNNSADHQPRLFIPNPLFVASDFDADISSLDTDVPDSSDN